jgi:chorismate mutase
MPVRGVRGATNVAQDTREEILTATEELLKEMLRANGITRFDDIASVFFTTTPDLVATFPAEAARTIGMQHVPLICASEIAVPGRLARCIRVLMQVNTDTPQREVVHVYLRDAKNLRPDIHSAQ